MRLGERFGGCPSDLSLRGEDAQRPALSRAGHGQRPLPDARRNQHRAAHTGRPAALPTGGLEAWKAFGGGGQAAQRGDGGTSGNAAVDSDSEPNQCLENAKERSLLRLKKKGRCNRALL